MVKVHPETGEKVIYAPGHAFGIPGMTPEESTKLLDDLGNSKYQEFYRPDQIYNFSTQRPTFGSPFTKGSKFIIVTLFEKAV